VGLKCEEIIMLRADSSVPYAFKILIKNNIYSAPVFDTFNCKYAGFLDLVDIITFIVQIFKETEVLGEDFFTLLEQETRFSIESTDKIVDLSKRNPFFPMKTNEPISKAMKLLGQGGIHKLPIMEHKAIVGLLSQSTVIDFLAKHIKELGPVVETHIRQFDRVLKPVICVKADDRAIEGFKLMAQHRISSVGVLDSDGSLLTVLSAKDIRVVEPDALFTKLYKSSVEFVLNSRKKEINATAPAIWCHMDDTLENVILKLAITKIHRIFIVDENRKPLGIISLGDIFSILFDSLGIRISK